MRQRWFSRRAILLHLAVVIVSPFCLVAGWWQATRAMSGNTLSYAYAIEWPVFSIIGVVMWWQLIHEKQEEIDARKVKRRREQAGPEVVPTHAARRIELESDELRAYNDYLASLPSRGSRKEWIDHWGRR